jgi:hypothetical protein
MAGIDLKALDKATIEKRGLDPHELWIVKIGEDIYGPFEGTILSDYASENFDIFSKAYATRLGKNDWQLFHSHAIFERRSPQIIKSTPASKEDRYWILNFGQKNGPLTKLEIDKRIELGTMSITDIISSDEGHSWHKIYEIEGFDRRYHSSAELPNSPQESEFNKARWEILQKLEAKSEMIRPSEELANMVHLFQQKGKALAQKAAELTQKTTEDLSIQKSFSWKIPVYLVFVIAIGIGVKFGLTTNPDKAAEVAVEQTATEKEVGEKRTILPRAFMRDMPVRKPANFNPFSTGSNQGYSGTDNSSNDSDYPTQVESHENEPAVDNDQVVENEPATENDMSQENAQDLEARKPAAVEHSLVGTKPEDHKQIDDVMGEGQPVEEASDL